MTIPTGWLCPSCGKAHRPRTEYVARDVFPGDDPDMVSLAGHLRMAGFAFDANGDPLSPISSFRSATQTVYSQGGCNA